MASTECNYALAPVGQVHPKRTVGLQQTPELLWRDPAVVGSLALCFISNEGPSVSEHGVAALCLVLASLRQWHPHPGEAGHEEVGI